ncbi:hypothetical protein O3M35_000762 [Rhynocoris fuscipes]|uniref:Uncharacterized protein n=1 Tax=Rhynocoris fuscipes TaxID=488301 RepID=A0AAW1DNT2_9HEMI
MEVIQKKRNPIRSQLIKNYDLLMIEVQKEEIDKKKVKIIFKTVERLKNALNVLDEEACNYLLESENEDNYANEIVIIEEFNEKYDCVSVKDENIFSYNIVVNESVINESAPGFLQEYNEIYSGQLLVEILVASLEPCGFGYTIIRGIKMKTAPAVDTYNLLLLCFVGPFLMYYCGQEISTQEETDPGGCRPDTYDMLTRIG